MVLHSNIDLKPYNTFGLSSTAEQLVTVQHRSDLDEYFSENSHPALVLGGGSNMLLTRDIPGTVLKMEIPGIKLLREDDEHFFVQVGAGEVWHHFVMTAIQNGWAGVENLSLIPGNVGAAPMQNIGAYGVELESVFHELEAYLIGDHTFETFNASDCQFGYRESVFKRKLKGEAIISSVTFRLRKNPQFNTRYGAIEEELERQGVTELSIEAISKAVIAIRRSKLPDPREIGNSGSFFKNPVIPKAQHAQLKAQFPNLVAYPSGDDHMKVAAGWLIEDAGFKGKRFGNYGVHDKQALVLVNHGGATGQEIFDLSENIIQTIRERYGITLEREVNVI